MSDTSETREVLSAKISAESAQGWKRFCTANGISLTAMVEVAGLQLADEELPPRVPERQKMVEMAREVDFIRRSRKPKS